MRRKYITKQWLIATAFFIGGILILTPLLITQGLSDIVIFGLCGSSLLFAGISHIAFAYNLRMYNEYLSEKTRTKTLNKLLRESNLKMENDLKQADNEPKQH